MILYFSFPEKTMLIFLENDATKKTNGILFALFDSGAAIFNRVLFISEIKNLRNQSSDQFLSFRYPILSVGC